MTPSGRYRSPYSVSRARCTSAGTFMTWTSKSRDGVVRATPLAPTIPTNRTRELASERLGEPVGLRTRCQRDRVVGGLEHIDSVEDRLREATTTFW
jgi:hypothetical protein